MTALDCSSAEPDSEPMQVEGIMQRYLKMFRFEDKNQSSLVDVDHIDMYGYIYICKIILYVHIYIYYHIKI